MPPKTLFSDVFGLQQKCCKTTEKLVLRALAEASLGLLGSTGECLPLIPTCELRLNTPLESI